jgi:hypothetical protein
MNLPFELTTVLPPLGGATFRWLYSIRFEREYQATGFAGGS